MTHGVCVLREVNEDNMVFRPVSSDSLEDSIRYVSIQTGNISWLNHIQVCIPYAPAWCTGNVYINVDLRCLGRFSFNFFSCMEKNQRHITTLYVIFN